MAREDHLHRGNPKLYKGCPSLNPKGRPKKEVCVTSWLKEYADTRLSTILDPKKLTYAQAAALQAWRAAAKGDLPCYSFIIERIEGKAAQKVTSDVTIKYKADELTDDQLAAVIARGGRGIVAPSVGPVSSN